MTSGDAKEILMLYRPGTADANDPDFAEALACCEQDAELKQWFEGHCAVYAALRAKFRQLPVPEGLKEQILSERKVRTAPLWKPALAAATAMLVVALVVYLALAPRESREFREFRGEMVSYALRAYAMQLDTKNPDEIRSFFTRTNGVADYVLPDGLQQKATPAGCVAMTWHGQPVAMICLQSGRPLAPGQASDVWFFVTSRSALPGAPAAATPKIAKVNRLTTASWSVGDKTYVLAVEGDETFLRSLL